MSRRSSITATFGSETFENISTNMDSVITVSDNIEIIKQLMDMPGFEDLLVDIRETLDFTNIVVESGAEADWDSVNKVLTVPTVKGDKGDDLTMISIVDNGDDTFTWTFSDGTVFTTPDLRGHKGDKGEQGVQGIQGEPGQDGVPVTLVSITDNGDYTFNWEFSDGHVYTTPTLRGHRGIQGEKGDSLSLDNVEHIGDSVFRWSFSDGTVFTTPRLRGHKGDKGDTGLRGQQGERGIGVHHLKGTSTTDPHGDFSTFGERDTYTFYGDADEKHVLGWFTIMNGFSSVEEFEDIGVMLRKNYDTDGSGVVDNAKALGGKTLAEIEQERDGLSDSKLDKAGGTIENDLTIQGNLYVNGTETFVNTETVKAKDNEIVINAGEQGNGVTKGTAGIRVDRGAEADYLFQFDETSDSFKIGEEGSLQEVATREGTPLDAGVAIWDSTSSKFSTTRDLNIDSLNTTGQVNNRDMVADGEKLDDIEEGATADQTAEEIETLYESNPDTNKYTGLEKQFVDVATTLDTDATTLPTAVNELRTELGLVEDRVATVEYTLPTHISSDGSDHTFIDQDVTTSASPTFANVNTEGLVDGRDVSVDGAKLDTIEENAKDDQVASEVPVTAVGSLVATNVQKALENLHTVAGTLTEAVERNTAVTGTSALVRYDKLLGNLDVVQMNYVRGDLTAVRYVGDNNADSFYRDVLVYSSGDLTSIKHFYNKPDLGTESAVTVLVYDVDSNLISTQYMEL